MTKKRVNFLVGHDNCNKRTRVSATIRLGKIILAPINPFKEKKKYGKLLAIFGPNPIRLVWEASTIVKFMINYILLNPKFLGWFQIKPWS